jgi:hypothetical protein
MREAGLPLLVSDVQGEQTLVLSSKGVVRAVYPDLNRVDIETEDGAYITKALVLGPYFPEVHLDGDAPAHVTYLHVRGRPEAFCWPETHRRLLGPQDTLEGQAGESQPERRYYHLHHYIFRVGDITVRISRDNRFVIETEQGDYIQFDQGLREIRLHAPTMRVGTDEEQGNRLEYQQDESFRAFNPLVMLGTETEDRIEYIQDQSVKIVTPQCVIGHTGVPETDGITYLENSLVHIISQAIKLTATSSITLDPPRINIGNANATERLVLGNALLALYNSFVTIFNAHQHGNVQNGAGVSGAPTTPTVAMTTTQLSDVAFVSKTGV